MRNLTPEEVYDNLVSKGFYEEANLDKDEVQKVLSMVKEDFNFAKRMKAEKNPSWRVIFNAYYDVLRELCDQLLRFKRKKISNHQGVFASMKLDFPDLDFDWELIERIRTLRNQNKYQGTDISEKVWKSVDIQFELLISIVMKEVEEKLRRNF